MALSLEARIKAEAFALGFDLAGITSLGPAETAGAFDEWLGKGYAGEMEYLTRGAEKRRDSRLPLPGARSAIVVAMNYGGREPSGPVARYARGEDYHDVILERLRQLQARIGDAAGRAVVGKAYVDTGPLLERDLARRAGLGWFGKNTNLINPRLGSFFFLGALLVDLELAPDAPFETDHCGTCTRCLDACPTSALPEARVLDATRCISYLTIELRGEIPPPLRSALAGHLYGCDICQDVCPWNVRFSRSLPDDSPFAPRAALDGVSASAMARRFLAMDDETFRAEFRGSPMKRAKLRGLKRNAAVALGNVGDSGDEPALTRALETDAVVREHVAWALDRIRTRAGATASPDPAPRGE
jgi:epoxyqueuosine reductase